MNSHPLDDNLAELFGPAGLEADAPPDLAALHRGLVEKADAAGLLDIAYRTVDTPVGTLLLAATSTGLLRVAYQREDLDKVLADLAAQVSPRVLEAPGRLDDAVRQLEEYFAGDRHRFDLPLDLTLSSGFRRTRPRLPSRYRLRPHGQLPGGGFGGRQPPRRPGRGVRLRHQPACRWSSPVTGSSAQTG